MRKLVAMSALASIVQNAIDDNNFDFYAHCPVSLEVAMTPHCDDCFSRTPKSVFDALVAGEMPEYTGKKYNITCALVADCDVLADEIVGSFNRSLTETERERAKLIRHRLHVYEDLETFQYISIIPYVTDKGENAHHISFHRNMVAYLSLHDHAGMDIDRLTQTGFLDAQYIETLFNQVKRNVA